MSEGARIAARVRAAVDEGAALFESASEEKSGRRPAPGSWCAREQIGHLIDSACNNQRRFVLNQNTERLAIDPYNQEAWVSASHHADTPAAELVTTWRAYNQQIARIIEHIPDETLNRPRGPIADYEFPYLDYRPTESATLRDLIEDYIGHIHHHLRQIRRLLA